MDLWIALTVGGSLLALIVVGVHHAVTRGSDPATWIVAGVALFYAAILAICAYPVSYEITSAGLSIRSGLMSVNKATVFLGNIWGKEHHFHDRFTQGRNFHRIQS